MGRKFLPWKAGIVLIVLSAALLCVAAPCLAEAEVSWTASSSFGFMLPEGHFLLNGNTLSELQQNQALWEAVSEAYPVDWAIETGAELIVDEHCATTVCIEPYDEEADQTPPFSDASDLRSAMGEAAFRHCSFELWIQEQLAALGIEDTDVLTLQVGDGMLWVAGGVVPDGGGLSSWFVQAEDPEGKIVRMRFLPTPSINSVQWSSLIYTDGFLGLTLDGQTLSLPSIDSSNSDAYAWKAYRIDFVINADGELCSPEQCGAQDALLLLDSLGNGLFFNADRAESFTFCRMLQEGRYALSDELVHVYEDDDRLSCLGASWTEAACWPHFVAVDCRLDTTSLVGKWPVETRSVDGDTIAMEWRHEIASSMDIPDSITIEFTNQGSGILIDSLSSVLACLAGDESADMPFRWVLIDDSLYFYDDENPVRRIEYALEGETFVLKATEALESFEAPGEGKVSAPIHYDGEAQMAKWTGLWGAEVEEGDTKCIYLFDFRADGVLDCKAISGWLHPNEVLDSVQMRWCAAENGVEIWRDSEEHVVYAGNNEHLDAPWELDGVQIARLSAYTNMMTSVQDVARLENILGVWGASGAQLGAGLQDVQFRLNPNGRCALTRVVLPGSDAAAAQITEQAGQWYFAEDGRTLMMLGDGQAESVAIAQWVDGVLLLFSPQSESTSLTRQFGLEA